MLRCWGVEAFVSCDVLMYGYAVCMMVRPMEVADADRVCALSEQLGYPITLEQAAGSVQRILGMYGHTAMVAVIDGQVVGWIHCYVSAILELPETFVEIGGLVVDENHRGQHVGSRLVEAAEEWAKSLGLSDLRVRSASHRAGAHEFYLRLGFALKKTQMRFEKSL